MIFWNWLKSAPVWLVVPSVFLAAGVATAVTHHEPLVFDPSLYEVRQAQASELAPIDVEGLERSTGTPAEDVELASAPATAATGSLADGTWTGYAECGKGNSDGWKPYYVAVTIKVSGGSVSSITDIRGSSTGEAGSGSLSWDAAENQSYLDWAIDGRGGQAGVKSQIEAQTSAGSASHVDTVSGATYSSAAIYNAYVAAVNKAAAAGGTKAVKPAKVKGSKGKSATKKTPVKADAGVDVSNLADGSWVGYASCGEGNEDGWSPYYVAVTVKVADGAVASIEDVTGVSAAEEGQAVLSWDAEENQLYLDWAVKGRTLQGKAISGVVDQIKACIAAGKSVSAIDAVSGATYSSAAIFKAYYAALAKSAAAAGSVVEVPAEAPVASLNDAAASAGGEPAEPSGSTDANEAVGSGRRLDDGSYIGYALCEADQGWSSYYVIVKANVVDGTITELIDVYGDAEGAIDAAYVYNSKENALYLSKAIDGTPRRAGVADQIRNRIAAGEQVTGIDAISGATISSKAIVAAYRGILAALSDDAAHPSDGADSTGTVSDDAGDAGRQDEGVVDQADDAKRQETVAE